MPLQISPYSLLKAGTDVREARAHAALLCGLPESSIQDIYPCTSLQEGLLALTSRRQGAYVLRHRFELRPDVDTLRLRRSWDDVVARNPILRTRIVSLPGHGLVQVVLAEANSQCELDSLPSEPLETDDSTTMDLGLPLAKFSIIDSATGGPRYFSWEMHHALYDGWSMLLLLQEVRDAYHHQLSQSLPQSMPAFIQHIQKSDDASVRKFWQSQFEELQAAPFPRRQGDALPHPDCELNSTINGLDLGRGDFTAATVIKAAWSIALACRTASKEALFGVTVTGRQAMLPGIESLVGPTIATVPVRITLDWTASGNQLLEAIQTQAADMIPFEQTGLAKIRRLGEDAATACDFQTLLVIQPASSEGPEEHDDIFVGESESEKPTQGFSTHGLVVECQLQSDGVHFHIMYDANLVQEGEMAHLMQNVESMLRQLVNEQARQERLGKMVAEQLTPWGLEKVWDWNATLPAPTEACIHDLISYWVEETPQAPAVCAWDGAFTYQQLDDESTNLALRLAMHGVHGKIVPLLFEKSMWTPVAAVAVMKAGGASVLLDQKQPEERLRSIVSQATSPVLLSSRNNRELAHRLAKGTSAVEVQVVEAATSTTKTSRVNAAAATDAAAITDALPLPRRAYELVAEERPSSPSSTTSSVFSVMSDDSSSSASDVSASPVASSLALPAVAPSDLLYVVFTSGSTGTPKGAMVTHRNFCSAITYQQKSLKYFSDSRVFDFASYAFDAAWCNLLHSLTAGGCICIPSNEERENDLAGSLERYNATHVDLTPSVARAVGSAALSKLSTLVLGGEAVVPSDAALTDYKCSVINVYGPAECTPTSTFAELSDDYSGIGDAAGVCTWVVDVDNPDALAPFGAPGELWVEGPLVGQGYLNDPAKTSYAFVEDPSWLLRGIPEHLGQKARPGRHGRVYRTGDLVQYNDDGTLMFVGRKDTQVKIRGQRVELAEIERHIQDAISLPQSLSSYNVQVIAETIQPKGVKGVVLVAFLIIESSSATQADESVFKEATTGIEQRLASRLPVYMVPSTYIPIQNAPMTGTGKLDRKRLRAMGEEMWMQYSESSNEDEPVECLSDTEILLQKVWMSVLNIPVEQASVTKSFMHMGGDSISAMQIVSQCRLNNLSITVSNVLQASTIRAIAALCQKKSQQKALADGQSQEAEESNDEDSNAPFALSPIQHVFFSAHPDGLDHFNQSFALELRRPIAPTSLRAALEAIVARHSMLRARFEKDSASGTWRQFEVEYSPDSFLFAEHFVQDRRDVSSIFSQRQEQLDIRQGPVFACDLFKCQDDTQVLAISAHHLVIDLVSWRILWKDIEDHLEYGELRSLQTASFRRWCQRQARVSRNASPLSVLPLAVLEPQIDFWGLPWSENTFEESETWTDVLSHTATSALFTKCNDALRTEPVDIILGALAYSFQQVFTERSVPCIWSEGHGREQFDESLPDVSETVGWFTTIKPLPIHISPKDSLLHAIRVAKDTRRSVPGNGQPYFACRHYSESGQKAFASHEFAEILFNFVGQFQQLESDEGLFKVFESADADEDKLREISTSTRRSAMIELNVHAADGELIVAFQIHKRMQHRDRIYQWYDRICATLESAVQDLLSAPARFTPSDLPLLNITYGGLDALMSEHLPSTGIKADQVTDIYPCSPVQEGVLLSYEKGEASYANFSVFRCVSTNELVQEISAKRLEEAWRKVAKRHTILSTVFCPHPEGEGFIQLVIPSSALRVEHITIESGCADSHLMSIARPEFAPNEPQHCFTICRSQVDQKEVAFRLDISHALFDAASEALLINEIAAAYEGERLAAAPPFSDMVRYIVSTPKATKIAAWTEALDGVEACEFPTSPGSSPHHDDQASHDAISITLDNAASIKTFCKEADITQSVFFKVAWAMVLAYFTGKHDVCFGYLTSGKDAPVDDVDKLLGPTISLLVNRVDLRATAREVLKKTSKDSMKQLDIQHTPLAEIQHHLGLAGQRLFNTAISILLNKKAESGNARTFSCQSVGGADPHEYDLGLSVAIEEENTSLTLEFQEQRISQQTAEEIVNVLANAVKFLIRGIGGPESDAGSHVDRTRASGSLAQTFFQHVVGAGESSTEGFWTDYFSDLQASHFPSAPRTSQSSEDSCTIRRSITKLSRHDGSVQAETLIKAAWACLAAKYQDSAEALFGVTSTGTKTAVPHRVALDWTESAQSLLQREQDQTLKMAQFQHLSLARIRQISDEAAKACDFQTLLRITVCQSIGEDESEWTLIEKSELEPARSRRQYPMVVSCELKASTMEICVDFDCAVVDKSQVMRICDQFEHIYLSLSNKSLREQKLQDLVVANQQDVREIWSWNAHTPVAWKECVHSLIAAQASKRPLAPALNAWDGNLTYQELDTLSTRLAHKLVALGVREGSFIPLCFEKSVWMPVAALGVMKAGGASVLVDVATQPESRIRSIVAQVDAKTILTSVSNETLVRGIGDVSTVVVGRDQFFDHVSEQKTTLPLVDSSATLYVVFTSGTTSVPKGVMISHRNFCSSIYHQRDSLGYRRGARVLDFSSYAFDVAWSNLINTLTVGGCLCIPSASERENSITECLEKYDITVADFTPSFLRHIEPKKTLSRLSTLLLGGESVLATDISSIGDETRIYNAYGPAECTPTSTIQDLTQRPSVSLGRGVGMNTWIVDINNPSALAPIGAVGELWLEGPLVGQGYVNNPTQTNASFVRDPEWLMRGPDGRDSGRLGLVYRTGDLVQYRTDGSLLFMGRKDTQVKIRGQRLELEEVENRLHQTIASTEHGGAGMHVVAEAVQPKDSNRSILVAFVALDSMDGKSEAERASAVQEITAGLALPLANLLPPWMIPSVYIPIRAVPRLPTGKVNRRQLRTMGAEMTMQDIAALSRAQPGQGEMPKQAPESVTEIAMQSLWANVLGLEPETISANDSFFRLGGDSIGAMKLAGMARQKGYLLVVRDVFKNPVLRDMAGVVKMDSDDLNK